MKVAPTRVADVLLLEPKVFGDERGFFFESFNQQVFEQATGVKTSFVQDNHSKSGKGVLRGLHYQVENAQGGTGVHDCILIVDIARAHLKAIELPDSLQCSEMNLGIANGYSELNVVYMFENKNWQRLPYHASSRRTGDLSAYCSDQSLTESYLG
jgi:hypothetical protein